VESKFETIEPEQMEFWIDVARSTLALIQLLLGDPSQNPFSTVSVKTGKSRSEQLFSDLAPKADLTADIVDVSQVP
jgi:hypothetical protein